MEKMVTIVKNGKIYKDESLPSTLPTLFVQPLPSYKLGSFRKSSFPNDSVL